MLLTDCEETPIGVDVTSASPHEVKLIEPLIDHAQVRLPRPTRLLYDKTADNGLLRRRMSCQGIRLIAPYRRDANGRRRRLSLRDRSHYSNRWKVERTIRWLKHFRRVTTR